MLPAGAAEADAAAWAAGADAAVCAVVAGADAAVCVAEEAGVEGPPGCLPLGLPRLRGRQRN